MNKPQTFTLAFDMDGYELFEGDYVACNKKLYRINKIHSEPDTINVEVDNVVLELIHVNTTQVVKRKSFEVERLN